MGFQKFRGFLQWPKLPSAMSGTPSLNAQAISAQDDIYGAVLQAPKTGNIRKVHFRTGTVSGTGSATVTVSIETVNHTTQPSVPSGTPWATNTSNTQSISNSQSNTAFAVTLTADAAVTRGQAFGLAIKNTTPGSITTLQISNFQDQSDNFPYGVAYGSGAWGTQNSPVVAIEYDDGSIEPLTGVYWMTATTSTTYNNGSTPDLLAARFQVPSPIQVAGCVPWFDTDGDFDMLLVTAAYHEANATGILASLSVDKDMRHTNGGDGHNYLFSADVDLSANTWYRLIVRPTSGTSLVAYDRSFGSLAQMDAQDGGQYWHLSTAKDPTGDGDWTNYNSGTFRSLFAQLLISGIHDGTGGGGVIARPGLHPIEMGIAA